MKFDYMITFATILNIILISAIIILLFKGVKGIFSFIKRNKEMEKKIDNILDILERNSNK